MEMSKDGLKKVLGYAFLLMRAYSVTDKSLEEVSQKVVDAVEAAETPEDLFAALQQIALEAKAEGLQEQERAHAYLESLEVGGGGEQS